MTHNIRNKKALVIILASSLVFSCGSLFPSPHSGDKDYSMKRGKLVGQKRVVDKNSEKLPLPLSHSNKSNSSGSSTEEASITQSSASTAPSLSSVIPTHYQDISYPQFQYLPPDPKTSRVVISDSITGYIISDRSLPFVQGDIYFRETTLPSKPEQVAAVALLGPMFRRGGAAHIPASVLDDSLEQMAASIGGDLGSNTSALSFKCLSRDLHTTLALLDSVYKKPAFDSSKLELQKNVYLQNLQHKFDTPSALANGLMRYALYQSSPRNWNSKPAEVKKVTSADLAQLAQGRFAPNRVVFAIAGDFDRDSMVTTLKNFFAHWQKPNAKPQAPVPLVFKSKPAVYVVDKPSITQANVILRQPFVKRPNPDYYATQVASYILGSGGFTSRLTLRIRSDEGLVYSVHSFAESDYDDVANTGVSLQTKVASTSYAIKLVFEEVQKLGAQGPTAAELDDAKKSLVESLPGMFDSPAATVDVFARSEMWGRSFNHFKDYPEEIRKITAEDVKRCIKKYFAPEAWTIAIAGPAAELQKRDGAHSASLADFGTIKIVPVDSLEMR